MSGVGILLVLAGLIFLGAEKLGIHPGRLPGDIRIAGKRGGFYFPIVTCLIVSALLTAISSPPCTLIADPSSSTPHCSSG